jgi:GNAT superfamily N-acetyltransferase
MDEVRDAAREEAEAHSKADDHGLIAETPRAKGSIGTAKVIIRRAFAAAPDARISGVVDFPDSAVVPHGQREISAEGVLGLYRTAGWWPERTAEQVRAVLVASPAVGAWHGEDLIGFARAVTDGVLRAYVEDVVVSPDWRGTGVGRALLAGLMEQLEPIPVVTLFCSADLVRYYEASSFRRSRQVVMHRA